MNVVGQSARRYRLLIVETDRHSFDEMRQAFLGQGHECEVALDLETALNILDERRMDIAVVNTELAECEDEELVDRLQERARGIRIALYNGTTDRARQRRLRRRGADSYLSEDSDIPAVIRAVQRIIDEKM